MVTGLKARTWIPAILAACLLITGCGPGPLDMTPRVDEPAEEDLQTMLLEAARGIEVVQTGDTRACLVEMSLQTTSGPRDHRLCLARTASTDATALSTACGRIATRHIVMSRLGGDITVTHTRMTLQSACPSGAQFECQGLEGSGLTLSGYTQPVAELAQARQSCAGLGGRWSAQ